MVSHYEPETLAIMAIEGADADDIDPSHLDSCVMCQAELDQLIAIVATGRTLTADDFPASPPEDLWLRIQQSVQGGAGGAVDELTARRNRTSKAPWIAVAAVAGLVIGGLGAGVVLSATPDDDARVIAQTELAPLNELTVAGAASVKQTQTGPVLSVSVPELPASDGYYEVWLLKPDVSSMISIGVLGAANDGTFPLPPGLDLAEFSVVDVSKEAFDGDATHSTDSVVRGTLPA
jgi:hypothetical protein